MYPKTFFTGNKPAMKPGVCFVVMPFSREFEAVFAAITGALESDLGLTCMRTKDLHGGGNIIEDILRGLGESEFVIVDVTGRNPNVFYELGIAHMCKEVERVILLAQQIDSIPFDLRHFRHIVYSPSVKGLKSLREALQSAVSAHGDAAYRIAVDKHGRGTTPEMLMGTDHCLYQFEVLDVIPANNAAKFRLRVTRHVMGRARESAVLFDTGMGLRVNEKELISDTGWSVCLERVAENRPVFRIDAAELPARAAGPRADRRSAGTKKRLKLK